MTHREVLAAIDRRYAESDRELDALDALWTALSAVEHRAAADRLLGEQDELECQTGNAWRRKLG